MCVCVCVVGDDLNNTHIKKKERGHCRSGDQGHEIEVCENAKKAFNFFFFFAHLSFAAPLSFIKTSPATTAMERLFCGAV